ncbi:L-2,4-diaminobutyrate decarboxylase [Gracilariopsis chorda]|uniref:L-2,4-diaminobutyrate decarboxylase n=1 Tax=Gracilariopsis chorda TaxID=448386 RepID=A0A2V3IIH7_9FLOR|nr:L-2,4-diaminobutyrate decarboxylase [Gracilariopsis chorda]|eukprot:PXF41887.1 L-2,4-diaminobutyrate decarboxylase [Gracilariopsis chorda]
MPKPHQSMNGPPDGYYKSMFRANGRIKRTAPKWLHTRQVLSSSFFPSPYTGVADSFRSEVDCALAQLEAMKQVKGGPAYLGTEFGLPDYSDVNEAEIPEQVSTLQDVVADMLELFEGMVNTAHPLSQPNVLPPANKASIIATLFANYFSQNFIEGEYAWNLEKAEMETSAMITRLIPGWDPSKAGGLFTYGGSGCYLYAVKYALAHVLQLHDSRLNGVRTDGKILVSQQGHYAKMNSTDWLGLGMDNIVDIETDDDTNAMDMKDLREKLVELNTNNIPVIAVICTMGTTDAFAIDPVDEVAALLDEFPNPSGYNRPLIYCDAVIGWSFLTFKGYDFSKNPAGITKSISDTIEQIYNKILKIQYADAVGVDFHKTGWVPYATSLFLAKDLPKFKSLMNRPGAVYLNERTEYNPGLYSLEVSRSAAPALSAWATLRYFGLQGFQTTITNVLEMSLCLREILKAEPNMICVNEEDTAFVTLFRVYPDDVDAETRYERELTEDSEEARDLLEESNILQQKTADALWWWLRSGSQIDGMYGPHTTYTSGFRTTDYQDDMGNSRAVIYALKSFPLNVNITYETMLGLVKRVKIARDMVLSGEPIPELPHTPICPPYSVVVPEVGGGKSDAGRTRITDMMSGVVGSRKKRHGRGI